MAFCWVPGLTNDLLIDKNNLQACLTLQNIMTVVKTSALRSVVPVGTDLSLLIYFNYSYVTVKTISFFFNLTCERQFAANATDVVNEVKNVALPAVLIE